MNLLCYIHSLASGGAERVLVQLANHWSQQGHHVAFVTNTPTDTDVYATDPAITRYSLQAPGASTSTAHAIWNTWHRKRRLRRLIEQLQTQCVIAFMPSANYIALAASARSSVPVIISERVYPDYLGLSHARWLLVKRKYLAAKRLVVLHELSAQWFRRKTDISSISVIPNGISLPLARSEATSVVPQTVVSEDRRLILSVGRLVEQKQPERILHAFAKVIANDAAWHLVLIGDGPKRDGLQTLCSALKITDRTTLLPHAGNLQDWYERADIYLSTSQYEGSPNALLEAMACGCAVAAFDCPTGPADIIQDHDNGLLVPLNEQSQFEAALAELIRDEVLRERLGQAATRIAHTFSAATFFAAWDRELQAATEADN